MKLSVTSKERRACDSGRTVVAGTECAADNIVGQTRDKRLIMLWYTNLVGRMVRRKESIEETVESAFAYETDVTNFYGTIQSRWPRLPQSMSVCRIIDSKPCARYRSGP